MAAVLKEQKIRIAAVGESGGFFPGNDRILFSVENGHRCWLRGMRTKNKMFMYVFDGVIFYIAVIFPVKDSSIWVRKESFLLQLLFRDTAAFHHATDAVFYVNGR